MASLCAGGLSGFGVDMSDGGIQWFQQLGCQQEYEEWLRNQEEQKEYQEWIQSLEHYVNQSTASLG